MNPSKKVVLIGWDAADWKVINPLMDAGKMPNVQKLVEQGSMAHIATLHPPLSPMLWTSIATGKRPFKHGIHGFSEPTADGLGIQPVTNLSRRCKAVWNIFSQNDIKSVVIGWWPSHPAEPINGVMLSDHYHRSRGSAQTKLAGHSGDDPPSGTHRDPGRAQAAPRGDRRRDGRPVRAQSARGRSNQGSPALGTGLNHRRMRQHPLGRDLADRESAVGFLRRLLRRD